MCSGDSGEGYMQKFFNFPYLYGSNPIRIISCIGPNPVWNYFLYEIVRSGRRSSPSDDLCLPYSNYCTRTGISVPVKSDCIISQILLKSAGTTGKAAEILYFTGKLTDESEKECYNSNVAAGRPFPDRDRGAKRIIIRSFPDWQDRRGDYDGK